MNGGWLLLASALLTPLAAAVATRYLRPKQTQAEELDALRADRAEDHARLNTLTDYVHTLREHIADGNPPPPPPWPDGLRQ